DLYITILSQLLNKIQKHSQIRLRLAKEYHFKLENRLLYKINVIQKAKGKMNLYIILPFCCFLLISFLHAYIKRKSGRNVHASLYYFTLIIMWFFTIYCLAIHYIRHYNG